MRPVALDAPVTRNKVRRAQRQTNPRVLPDTVSHGSARAYDLGCRCDPCTDALALRQREYQARRRGDLPAYEPPGRTHGTISCYQHGCRCADCRKAAREQRAKYRAKERLAVKAGRPALYAECVFCGEPFDRPGPHAVHERACQRRRNAA